MKGRELKKAIIKEMKLQIKDDKDYDLHSLIATSDYFSLTIRGTRR